jgi:hypothetical protein
MVQPCPARQSSAGGERELDRNHTGNIPGRKKIMGNLLYTDL